MTREEILKNIDSKIIAITNEDESDETRYSLLILDSAKSKVSLLPALDIDIPEFNELLTTLNKVTASATLVNLRSYVGSINGVFNKLPLTIDTKGFLSIEQEFSEKLATLTNQAKTLEQESDNFISSQESRVERLETIESNATKAEDRLNKHLGSLTNGIKAGEYSESASKHSKTSFLLMIGAILCFISGAVIIAIALFTSGDDPKFTALLSKVLSSAILLLPGLYLARESGKHFKERIRSQRMAHELAGLDNYFADFENSEAANKVKTALAMQYFGRADEIYNIKDEKLLPEKVMEFLGKEPE